MMINERNPKIRCIYKHITGGDKGGGGLTMIYRDTLQCHEWEPNVPDGFKYIEKERQWLLISSGEQKTAFLHCYIACQNDDNSFISWNEDLFHLLKNETIKLKQDGFTVLALGDFNSKVGRITGLEQNSPDINRNQPMFMDFIQEANLVIINSLPIAKAKL